MFGAIDVGGTKTLVAVFNNKGDLVEHKKFPTPQDYESFLRTLSDTIKTLETKEFEHTTIAIPGLINRHEGAVISCGNLPWKNIAVRDDTTPLLNCPVTIENDANLAGLSEALLIQDTYHKVLYITVSTGIGGVFIVNGEIDPNTIDMEVGYLLLEHEGRLMRWQEFASGKAIVEKFGKKASEINDPQTWYVIARNIAIGLVDLIATLTPDAIVIGGGVGAHLDKFKAQLDEQLRIYDNPMIHIPPILQAKRAEEAVIYGCYAYAEKQHERIHR